MSNSTFRLFNPSTGSFDIFTVFPDGPNGATNLLLLNILMELKVANELTMQNLNGIATDDLREMRVDASRDGST